MSSSSGDECGECGETITTLSKLLADTTGIAEPLDTIMKSELFVRPIPTEEEELRAHIGSHERMCLNADHIIECLKSKAQAAIDSIKEISHFDNDRGRSPSPANNDRSRSPSPAIIEHKPLLFDVLEAVAGDAATLARMISPHLTLTEYGVLRDADERADADRIAHKIERELCEFLHHLDSTTRVISARRTEFSDPLAIIEIEQMSTLPIEDFLSPPDHDKPVNSQPRHRIKNPMLLFRDRYLNCLQFRLPYRDRLCDHIRKMLATGRYPTAKTLRTYLDLRATPAALIPIEFQSVWNKILTEDEKTQYRGTFQAWLREGMGGALATLAPQA